MIWVDNARLRGLLHKRLKETSQALEMHYSTFYRKLQGSSPWTIEELNKIEEKVGIGISEFVEIKKAA